MNLLETLLGFAHGEEDPITEMLAWFLRTSLVLQRRTLVPFGALVRLAGGRLPTAGADDDFHAPTVQLIASNPRGTACRYDLVCDWHSPRVRLIVEVKVWSGLTGGVDTGDDGESALPAHQVTRYLTVAKYTPEISTFVVVLAPYLVDLAFKDGPPPGYAGQVTWQTLHDVFARTVESGALAADPTMAALTRNFVQLLETKRMAVPKLTFDVLTSVSRYRQFEKSARMMLTHARDALVADDGALKSFYKGNSSAWQDGEYDRMGWRVWVSSKDINAFAFVGIHVGADTIHEEVPDLYFFVQARKGSPALKALEADGDEVRAAVHALTTETTRAFQGRGGWEVYGIRRSLVEIARAADPSDAAMAFFRECVSSEHGAKLLSLYLGAVRTEGS